MSDRPTSEFEKAAASQGAGSLLADFWDFLRNNKKWWLLPVLSVLLLFGLLILVSGTGLGPFLYTLW